ncbi:hypothetical protein ACFYXD_23375 [Streptomyces platensis]|uniref:hypothetical protein n=1 Tax=Streptomyces platensis TaxID=58346 RepID=UPI0036B68C2E
MPPPRSGTRQQLDKRRSHGEWTFGREQAPLSLFTARLGRCRRTRKISVRAFRWYATGEPDHDGASTPPPRSGTIANCPLSGQQWSTGRATRRFNHIWFDGYPGDFWVADIYRRYGLGNTLLRALAGGFGCQVADVSWPSRSVTRAEAWQAGSP